MSEKEEGNYNRPVDRIRRRRAEESRCQKARRKQPPKGRSKPAPECGEETQMGKQEYGRIPDHPRNRQLLKAVRAAAEEYEKEEIAQLPFSKYRIYFETGSRLEYEACYIAHRRRLNVYTAMALSSEDERWVKGLEDILWAVCDEFTWAFPAHIKDWTDLSESRITIDLFAGETGLALSEACHLVGDRISPVVRDRVEQEVRARILTPYKEKNLKFHKDNWSAVCAGSIGMAALYWGGLEEYSQIDEKVMGSMEDFLGSYQDDGCCLEGALYWGYGFGYFCYFAAMLRAYTDGKRDLFRREKVKQIALFRQKIYLEKDVVVPFADAPHNYGYHIGLLHFLAKEYPEAEVPDEAYGVWFDGDIRHRFADFIRDFYWYDPELKPRLTSQPSVLFYDSQWYFERRKRYFFGGKGGRNNEPHNHNDIGHFILYSEGKFILDDLGWPEYDGDYFGERRYENLCASSKGHSVPILDGAEQEKGREHCSGWVSTKEGQVALDLTRAYPEGSCRRLVRSFVTEEKGILIRDELEGGSGLVRERFVTRIAPVVEKDRVYIGGWQLVCRHEDVRVEVTEETFKPRLDICKMDMKPLETAYLIDFVIPAGKDKLNMEFEITRI